MSVLILGGGPAGSAAALTLLAAGVDVTILDQSLFPRYRPGETLHPGIEPLLARLGALEPVLDAHYLRHLGHWVEWAGPAQLVPFGDDSGGSWRGFQVSRADFDQRLLSTARRNGAMIFLGRSALSVRFEHSRVAGVDTPHGPIAARVTIDCSGSSHWLARQLGISLQRHSPQLIARYGYATGRAPRLERLPVIRADSQGWTWISEVAPDRFHWTRVTRPHNRPPIDWVPGVLRELAPEPSRGADVTWRIARRTAGPGWFLAGDAAAVLDPSSSHGVLRAMMTGMLAGHLAAKVLRDQASESACERAYHEWLFAWFRNDTTQMTQAYQRANLFAPRQDQCGPRYARTP